MAAYCEVCRDFVEYKERDTSKTKVIKGKKISYFGKEAYCAECDNEIHVAEIRDYNLEQLDKTYRETENLITKEEILKILEIYNIAKRPLSLLLGWGELTVSRYLDGDIPSKQYSDVLKKLLMDHEDFAQLLDTRKEKISEYAYKKCKYAIDSIRNTERVSAKVTFETKIESVTAYILEQCEDITPLALQKLLYYAQAFNKVFNEEFLFSNDCEAWVHGPVYRQIYEKYRQFTYTPIEQLKEAAISHLEENEKELLDSIMINFGCYSGGILEKMTHIEAPWSTTRKGLREQESCNRIIIKDLISDYFGSIKVKYKMLNVSDIRDYSTDLFNKIKA
ncbi:MAG TPA: type II toxin-antitoxin system antitoxin SocA domain-containing protein [Bacilli bacterium]